MPWGDLIVIMVKSNGNAKVLFVDIETAGVNALRSDLGFVICFGFKWAGEKRAHCLTIDQFGSWKGSVKGFSDKKLLEAASKIFNAADIVVAHFGSVFDRRFLQGRLLLNNLPPIPNTKMRDTCIIARSVANFSSNRLKHLAKILGLKEQKRENGWPQSWMQVMAGDKKALKRLADYCKGDVLVLEELYNRLAPFDSAGTRKVFARNKCGECGGEINYRGFSYQQNKRYRRFVCKDCGKWGRETNAVKES